MSDATAAEATDREYPPLHRNPDFVRFLSGQFVSNAGDSLYTVAVMWLVFELSGSTVLTGVANALLLLPYLLQIIAGPVVDRLPVKPVLVAAQVAQGRSSSRRSGRRCSPESSPRASCRGGTRRSRR
jgi:MFS family permease